MPKRPNRPNPITCVILTYSSQWARPSESLESFQEQVFTVNLCHSDRKPQSAERNGMSPQTWHHTPFNQITHGPNSCRNYGRKEKPVCWCTPSRAVHLSQFPDCCRLSVRCFGYQHPLFPFRRWLFVTISQCFTRLHLRLHRLVCDVAPHSVPVDH